MNIFKTLLLLNTNKIHRIIQSSAIRKYSRLASSDMTEQLKNSIDSKEHWFSRGKPVVDAPAGTFRGILDRFNGITIDSSVERETDNFSDKLKKSLEHWISCDRRGIWFRVHNKEAAWVPVLVENGFLYHHTKRTFVMMCRWLPENEIEGFPPYAHTMIGVGGLVINDKNEVLAVSEKNSLIPNSWKLPGGYVEPGEYFAEAAVREIQEETNIKTKFDSIVSLRHAHGAGFGCSDLYIVVSLIPETSDLIKCEREIAAIQWMNIDEFLNHPNVHETNRSLVRAYLENKANGVSIKMREDELRILQKKYQIYSIEATTRNKL